MTRGRRPNPIPSVASLLTLPEDVQARVTMHLFSKLEGRVPQGAYQRFYVELLTAFFEHRRLDLAPFANCEPEIFIVSGSEETIQLLQKVLKGEFK